MATILTKQLASGAIRASFATTVSPPEPVYRNVFSWTSQRFRFEEMRASGDPWLRIHITRDAELLWLPNASVIGRTDSAGLCRATIEYAAKNIVGLPTDQVRLRLWANVRTHEMFDRLSGSKAAPRMFDVDSRAAPAARIVRFLIQRFEKRRDLPTHILLLYLYFIWSREAKDFRQQLVDSSTTRTHIGSPAELKAYEEHVEKRIVRRYRLLPDIYDTVSACRVG